MSASWRTGPACTIMQPTTIYHCPRDEFITKLEGDPFLRAKPTKILMVLK
ncbi:hypothetical protein [Acetobacterium bakii]|nr:hypothetical protein [Acetobacterium bakii]